MINIFKKSILFKNLLFTLTIVLLYLFLKNIPLSEVRFSLYEEFNFDLDNLLHMTVGGTRKNYYVMSLGITPYIVSSLVIQIILAFKSEKSRSRITQKKINQLIVFFSFFISIFMSALVTYNLDLLDKNLLSYCIAFLELVAGSSFTIWLVIKNKEKGVGGPSPIIISNIISGLYYQFSDKGTDNIVIIVIISLFTSLMMIFMEFKEKRIYIQRVSIHSTLANKNYLAIKYNPIGVMPIMFSSAFFILLQFLIYFLLLVFPNSFVLLILKDSLSLTKVFGILIYLFLLLLLTILFSFIFINPSLISEQLLKNGDSIINISVGEQTRKCLNNELLKHSIISGIVLCFCIGLPFLLQYNDILDYSLAMVPTSFMVLSGILSNIYQECYAIKCFDSYKKFL